MVPDCIIFFNFLSRDAVKGDVNFVVCGIIRRRISKNDLQVADDLLSRLYSNKNRNFSWYELLDEIIIDDPDEIPANRPVPESLGAGLVEGFPEGYIPEDIICQMQASA